jgi:hypothetical protein
MNRSQVARVSVEIEIAQLRNLDLRSLRRRWQTCFRKPAPEHLPRHLLLAMVAYRIQTDRVSDLDRETRQLLDTISITERGSSVIARLKAFDQRQTGLTPGTVLVREWGEASHHVMVTNEGFAWNGKTYKSLSQIAFAITGTRWNGPRFFGLRGQKLDQSRPDLRP